MRPPYHAWGGASAQSATAAFTAWLTNFGAQGPGYQVTQGAAQNFSCAAYPNSYTMYLGSCFGNNSATPYILAAPPAPPSPQPNNLPAYLTSNFAATDPDTGTSGFDFYQLGANEAIVTVIVLPPVAAYYSWQSYMFERAASEYPGRPLPPPGTGEPPGTTNCLPGDPYPTTTNGVTTTHKLTWDCNYDEFGYFSNTINNADVLAQYGTAFNTDPTSPTANAIAIVTTANTAVFSALQSAFNSSPHLQPTQLFLDTVGPPAPAFGGVYTGLGSLSGQSPGDVFASIFRLTYPQDQGNDAASGLSWIASSPVNVQIYRVEVPLSVAATGNPEMPVLLSPGNNTREAYAGSNTCPAIGSNPSSQSYNCDLVELGTLLTSYLATQPGSPTYSGPLPTVPPTQFSSGGIGPAGPGCITNGTACAGGTQDNNGYYNFNIGNLVPDAPAFVLGVDHSTSSGDPGLSNPVNNADYTGVSAAIDKYNIGASDIIQPNSAATFPVSSVTPALANYLLGSGVTVVADLTDAAAKNNQLGTPSQALTADAPNLYVAEFQRQGTSSICPPGSTAFFCKTTAPFVTVIQSQNPILKNFIPAGLSVLVTERGYNLPLSSPAPTTGANATYIQPPYVVYDPNAN